MAGDKVKVETRNSPLTQNYAILDITTGAELYRERIEYDLFSTYKGTIYHTTRPQPQWNACSIVKEYKLQSPWSGYREHGSRRHVWSPSHTMDRFFNSLPAVVEPPVELDWAAARDALMDDALGVMPRNASLAVNIAELASLKTLAPALLKGISSIPKLFRSKHGHRPVRNIAGSHLAYEFGLQPLLGDLKHFFTLRKQIEGKRRRIEKLIRDSMTNPGADLRARTPQINISDTVNLGRSGTNWDLYFDGVKFTFSRTGQGTLHARGRVTLYDDVSRDARLIIAGLGLNNPLSVAWELVPFSWLVDWVLPVGKLIDRVPLPRHLGAAVKSCDLFDYRYSYWVDTRREWEVDEVKAAIGTSNLSGCSRQLRRKEFHRGYGWPSMNILPPVYKGLSVRQTAILTSISVQWLPKLRDLVRLPKRRK